MGCREGGAEACMLSCGHAQVTTIKALENAKGTLKASSRPMPGMEKCEVICCSYYDDKPFHMMGNTTAGVTVIEFHRRCYSTATQVRTGAVSGRVAHTPC